VLIVLVDEDAPMARRVQKVLAKDGHTFEQVAGIAEAKRRPPAPQAEILVLMRPRPHPGDLLELRGLRKAATWVPILVILRQGKDRGRLDLLKAGADDCLVAPFSERELRTRVEVLVRRNVVGSVATLKSGDIVMDLVRREVTRGTRRVRLTPREFALLEYLLRRPGEVLSRTVIANAVWGHDFDWRSNVIDAFIKLLRKKLEAGGEPRIIQSLRGVGFALRERSERP